MQIDIFPVVWPEMPLQAAFDAMKSENRSAVVVNSISSFSLVEAVDVVVAIAEKTATNLVPLTKRHPMTLIQPADVGLSVFDFREGAPHVALEKYLRDSKAVFALVGLTSARAIVASRHEDDMPVQAGPKDCFCKSDRKEVLPGKNGGNCPHDASHVGTVRCR
jgi:hypothetical protein